MKLYFPSPQNLKDCHICSRGHTLAPHGPNLATRSVLSALQVAQPNWGAPARALLSPDALSSFLLLSPACSSLHAWTHLFDCFSLKHDTPQYSADLGMLVYSRTMEPNIQKNRSPWDSSSFSPLAASSLHWAWKSEVGKGRWEGQEFLCPWAHLSAAPHKWYSGRPSRASGASLAGYLKAVPLKTRDFGWAGN